MSAAVQHERAPRPAVAAHHQLALQKFSYNFTRPTFFPTPTPLTFSPLPPLHYTPPEALTHNTFFENSFQDFSRLPESMLSDVSHLSTQAGSLGPLNPFKIPLFSAPLHYPVTHPGYFPTNIFYPPVVSESSTASEQTCSKYQICSVLESNST